MTSTTFGRWVATCALATVASSAMATEAINMTSVIAWFEHNNTLGWRFVANMNFDVTKLGYFDHLGDGFVSAHEVSLFEWLSGTQVATATLPSGTAAPLEGTGFYRYVPIAPVQLVAGREYIIWGHNGLDLFTASGGHSAWTSAPEITVVSGGSRYSGWGGQTGGGSDIGYDMYAGPNFIIGANPVPEPATLGLAGLALAGAARRRLRHRA